MKTINSDFIRSYDKLKDDIFHAKKQQFKKDLRSKAPKIQPPKLKKIFPWRTLIKLSSMTGLVYFFYNYTDSLIDYSVRKKYINQIDLISLRVLKQDLWIKINTLINKPQEYKKISHMSNYMYQNQLQKDLISLNKTYPTHKVKSSVQSKLKIWIFYFNNYQQTEYINEYGDYVQRKQNSFLRIWRYPVFKNRVQKVLHQEKLHQFYRTMIHHQQTKDQNKQISNKKQQKRNQQIMIQNQIQSKCQRINIFNKFTQNYEDLLIQCRKNGSIGKSIVKILNQRNKLYPYPQIKIQST